MFNFNTKYVGVGIGLGIGSFIGFAIGIALGLGISNQSKFSYTYISP
jgi:hypothetical protein